MNLFDLKDQRSTALNKAESILTLAENAKRDLSASEQQDVDGCMTTVKVLDQQIRAIESKNTLIKNFKTPAGLLTIGNPDNGRVTGIRTFGWQPDEKQLSAEYVDSFFSYIASKGTKIGAALYEGSDGAGGYAVPVVVSDQIVPLAPKEMAVRRLASVIPTTSDIKIPQKGSFGTASTKAENAAFVESDPTLSQITLSAFMNGNMETISWELAQDVPTFQQFCVTDLILAVQMLEEGFYVSGTGSGQAQ